MADLPMIKIAADTESGWMLINESDFNPEEDDPYEPASSALVPGAEGGVAEAAKAAGEFLGEDWPAPGPLLDPPAPGAMAGGADLEDMTLTQLRKLASDSQGDAAPTRHSRPLASDPRRTTGSAAN